MLAPRPGGPRRRGRRGMSLLEVLLATAIFLMALAAIAQLFDQGADRGNDTIFQNLGTRLAQSKLAEVEAGVVSASSGGGGTFDDEPGWQWSVESTAGDVPNVYSVTVKAFRESGGSRFEVALAAMVFDPVQLGSPAASPPPTTTTTTDTASSGTTGATP